MPDKDIMLQIRAREEGRCWAALDAFTNACAPGEDGDDPASGLLASLAALAEDWRATADLYDRAKLKGAKTAYIDPLRHAAAELDKVVKALEQPRRAPLGQLQAPAQPESAGLDEPVHTFKPGASGRTCAALVERGNEVDGSVIEGCGRFASHPAHRMQTPAAGPGLDALIADQVAKARGEVITVDYAVPASVEPPVGDRTVVEAYLRGEIDDLPTETPRALVGAHDMTETETAFAANPVLVAQIERAIDDPSSLVPGYRSEQLSDPARNTAREILETMPVSATIPPVPMLGQPGDAGAGYDHAYIPPGGVPMTYAELLTPVPAAALPPHLSHSQIGTVGECPVKYRAQRLGDTPRTEIPQWANIGGNAFHAWVEAWERSYGDVERSAYGAAELTEAEYQHEWMLAFDAEIAKIEATSPVPRSRWRPANKGVENEGWWRAQGPLMPQRYLDARPAEATWSLPEFGDGRVDYTPAIELERTVGVDTPYGELDYKAILDRVTVRTDPASNWITLVIRDYKTSRNTPESTQQPGEYANVLRLLGVPARVKIVGTYFMARTGKWTPEVDLSEWTPEWFSYYVASGHAQRVALTTGPTPARPTSYCGGCAVRWACPVKTPRPASP